MTIENSTGVNEAILRMTEAYRTLEQAKSDCADVVAAELDNLVSVNPGVISGVEKKNLIKIAKAMAAGKQKTLKVEAESMADLTEHVL